MNMPMHPAFAANASSSSSLAKLMLNPLFSQVRLCHGLQISQLQRYEMFFNVLSSWTPESFWIIFFDFQLAFRKFSNKLK